MKNKMTVLKLKKIVDNMNPLDIQMHPFKAARREGYINYYVGELTEEYFNNAVESSNIDDVKENIDNYIDTAFKTIIAMSPEKCHPFIRTYYALVIRYHDMLFYGFDHTNEGTRGDYLKNITDNIFDCIKSVVVMTMDDEEVFEYECK